MLRQFTAIIVGTALIFPAIAPAFAKTYTVPPLAFNAISAVAKEKGMQKGLETTLKEQNTAWFWELGGGVEKAMTANNEAEFTEALNKNIGTVKTLYTLGMQYAEGKYGDMAMTLADEAVGKLNNPAATAVWEMIKLTNQSYKAVASTGAALNIEMLYNQVNTDRRIVGKSSGGAPPTIDVNKQTVDYFFNKYLITNSSVRAMVKSYVETTLGGTWPEESWNSYMIGKASGSGEATKAEAELGQLQSDEFRNTARGWIRALLLDVNKQVKVEYYRLRVRQEMAEYKKYADKVGSYYEGGYPLMWQIMRKKKAATKKIPEYKKRLEKIKVALLETEKAYTAATDERMKREVYEKWYPTLNKFDLMTSADSAETYMLDNSALYEEIEKARSNINKMRGLLAKVVEDVYDGSVEMDPKWDAYVDSDGLRRMAAFDTEVMLAKFFRPLIIIEDLGEYSSDLKPVVNEGVRFLNKGDFEGTKALWDKKLGTSGKSIWTPVYKSMTEVNEKINKMCTEDPSKKTEFGFAQRAKEEAQAMKANQSKLSAESMKKIEEKAIQRLVKYWGHACKYFEKELSQANGIIHGRIAEQNATAYEVMDAYKSMSKVAKGKYSQTSDIIIRIREMTKTTEQLRQRDTSGASLSKARGSGDWCPTVPGDKDAGLLNTGARLLNRAMLTHGYGSGESYFKMLTNSVNESVKKHESAKDLWDNRARLSQEDMNMIGVFVEGVGDFSKTIKEANDHVALITNYVSAEKADLARYLSKARSAYNECADKDERFAVHGEAFKKWQANIIKSGHVKVQEGKLVHAKLVADASGMIKVNEPYRHYLTTAGLNVESNKLKKFGLNAALRSYLSSSYPKAFQEYNNLIELKGITPARGANMDIYNTVYLDDVLEMRNRFENAKVGEESFKKLMEKASVAFPSIVEKYNSAVYLIFTPQPSGIEAELKSETGKAYIELAKSVKRRWKDHNDAVGAQMQKQWDEAEEKRKKEKEKLGTLEPIDASGYWVVDARLNYQRYPASDSSTILTKSNLQSGKIYFSGRINTLENVEKVLFSIDGGRSWQERQTASNIRLEVTPTPGKEYEPVIKLVRSEGFDPVVLSFSNDTKVKYSNENYNKRIVGAMKTIAETYERQNLAGFTRLIADDFIGGRSALEEGVRFDFEMFTNIQLKLYISRITETRDGKFVVSTKWDKTHIPRSTGSQQKTSGSTVITLVRGAESLKIQNLRGDLLYATLSPDIAAASGLSTAVVTEITTARDNRTPSQPGAGGFTGTTGSSSASTSLISVRNVSKDYLANNYFDFDNATWSTPAAVGGSDMLFEATYGPIVEAGTATYVKMAGTFDALSTAPDAGYAVIWPAVTAGDVYAFKTGAGLYGKFKLDSSTDISGGGGTNKVVFRYSIQTDGSKNIATQ